MNILKQGIEYLTDSPFNIKQPIFIKEFSKENQQLNDLEALLTRVSQEDKKYIEKDIKLMQAGLKGEQNVYFEIQNSFLPIICLHDIRLVYKEHVAQIDYVVITPANICILECKKLTGDIEITNKGDFIRFIKNYQGKLIKKEGMYSPITQNERHIAILTQFLRDELKYKVRESLLRNIVVVADPKTIINDKYAPKSIKDQIIKYDQLKVKLNENIEKGKDKNILLKSDMYNIAKSLMAYHQPLAMDYSKKYKLESSEQATPKVNSEVIDKINIEVVDKVNVEKRDKDKDEDEDKVIDIDKVKVEAKDLYEELRAYRLKQSRQEQVKPYFVFNNAQLETLVTTKPTTLEEFIKIQGFGEVKCQRYGQAIVDIIKECK